MLYCSDLSTKKHSYVEGAVMGQTGFPECMRYCQLWKTKSGDHNSITGRLEKCYLE